MAKSIFSVIEGLTVDRDDIIEAELFAEQYLSAEFPDYDFRQGTALRDMTIRPNATLLALVSKAIKFYFDDSDVINMTNETDDDLVDRKLSNFFITRKSGDKAKVSARLFFSFPLTKPISTLIPASSYFSVDNEVKFYPSGNITVLAPAQVEDPDSYYFKYDGSSDQWYVDVELESSTDDEAANVESGDLLYFTIFSPYFLRGEIQALTEIAVSTETNEEMVKRSYTSVSTRNLINTPSIVARIGDKYNYVGETLPVGLGHDWLYRDLIEVADPIVPELVHEHHRGGHTDVYLETNPILQTLQLTAEEDRDNPGEVAFYIKGPVYGVTRALEAPAGGSADTVQYYRDNANKPLGTLPFIFTIVNSSAYGSDSIPVTPSKDLGLSSDQLTKIKFANALPLGSTASFVFKTFQGVGSVQTGLTHIDERVVCADFLYRSFEPMFIDIDIELHGATDADTSIVDKELDKYVRSVPSGGILYVSEILKILTDSTIGIFKMPVIINATRIPRDITGDQDGPSNVTTNSVIDKLQLLPIQKAYVRNVTYTDISQVEVPQ